MLSSFKKFDTWVKLNRNREIISDNKWVYWKQDIRFGCIYNYPLRRGVITSAPVDKLWKI